MTAQPVADEVFLDVRLPTDRLLTWADLQAVPDDQHWRYQLVEGQLLVSPAPDLRHQTIVLELAVALRSAAPADLQVVISPFDFVPVPETVLQPDVLVVERGSVERQKAVVPPLLAVEVLSPSSRMIDRRLKRAVYEQHGVPSYWIVDPVRPSLLALELEGGRYVEAASVTGSQPWTAQRPFPVTVVPADLLDE